MGAASCIEVYLNGSYIGYAEGAHNTAEFDLTDQICNGQNELVAVVHKWTNGTYLECQDMFRNNGIFRDVLLYQTDSTHIWDYACRSRKEGETYALDVEVTVNNPSGALTASLMDGEKMIATASCDASDGKLHFNALAVEEWNAESPRLYDLYLTLSDADGSPRETVRERYGFKTAAVQDGIYQFNGKPVKLRGVNHHDSSPTGGYTMTPEELLRDVTLMKELNVNCVRTSHYPPDPFSFSCAISTASMWSMRRISRPMGRAGRCIPRSIRSVMISVGLATTRIACMRCSSAIRITPVSPCGLWAMRPADGSARMHAMRC